MTVRVGEELKRLLTSAVKYPIYKQQMANIVPRERYDAFITAFDKTTKELGIVASPLSISEVEGNLEDIDTIFSVINIYNSPTALDRFRFDCGMLCALCIKFNEKKTVEEKDDFLHSDLIPKSVQWFMDDGINYHDRRQLKRLEHWLNFNKSRFINHENYKHYNASITHLKQRIAQILKNEHEIDEMYANAVIYPTSAMLSLTDESEGTDAPDGTPEGIEKSPQGGIE